jgi:asparagine synthase (glutamine-hydrolysing)
MSIIFGVRKLEGDTVAERHLLDLAQATGNRAPDGTFVNAKGRVGMGFQPHHTHQRSNLESQPTIDERGSMLTLDGRLDNHIELCNLLDIREVDTSDSLIVLTAFERWGEGCFSQFIGDWALALWSEVDRSLYLARDHAGTRTLYFELRDGGIRWSSLLETFFVGMQAYGLDEDFAASYLSCQPIRDLTPYKGISAVSPAHYLKFRDDVVIRKAHWAWMVKDQISYRNESEYDDQFRDLFRQAVARRTGPGKPAIAHLSGGVDSTSIVCMSDFIRRNEGYSPDGFINTLSFYDDTERDWNERPFFLGVEAARGKKGIHVDVALGDSPDLYQRGDLYGHMLPGSDRSSGEREQQVRALCASEGIRAIICGIGGDELLGGVATPIPELADLWVAGNFVGLWNMAMLWSLSSRRPLYKTIFETLRHSAKLYWSPEAVEPLEVPWLPRHVHSRVKSRVGLDESLMDRLSIAPSRLLNGLSWWLILETLPHRFHAPLTNVEYRYPFLDRDLVDFLLRLPRHQIVGPGRRRLLMRRALAELVPGIVLERRRKSYVSQRQHRHLRAYRNVVESLDVNAISVQCGLVDLPRLRSAFDVTDSANDPIWAMPLIRAITLTLWLEDNSMRVCPNGAESLSSPKRPIFSTSVKSR